MIGKRERGRGRGRWIIVRERIVKEIRRWIGERERERRRIERRTQK
jgi:hypothetical protein